MSIWKNPVSLEALASAIPGTAVEALGIEFTEIGSDYLRARMPVDHRHHQPHGILHGGISCVLAETLGSTGSQLCVDPERYRCLGLDINANHLRPVSSGFVYGEARPIHLGRATHVWEIHITDEKGRMVCISRLTMMIKSV